jgi:hypothetical protein
MIVPDVTRAVAGALCVGAFLAWTPWALAEDAVGPQDPPLCSNTVSLKGVRKQYEGLEQLKENLKVKEIAEVKQLHFGPSPASVNQYANKTNYGTKSRYCQGTAMLANGKAETVYWRMDYLVAASGHSINFDHCSPKHNLLDSDCHTYREGK